MGAQVPRSDKLVARVLELLKTGVFRVVSGEVYKGDRKLAVRINRRRRMETGDPRVDLCFDGVQSSWHISHLVWMQETGQLIPPEFEIHHRDEDHSNNDFDNLLCVHKLDHAKLHYVPF
jgi:hypothetical protein